jgi:hypothetical protein
LLQTGCSDVVHVSGAPPAPPSPLAPPAPPPPVPELLLDDELALLLDDELALLLDDELALLLDELELLLDDELEPPLPASDTSEGLLEPFAQNPNDVEAPFARVPFQLRFEAVSCPFDGVTFAFQ